MVTKQPLTLREQILGYWPIVSFFIGISIAGVIAFTVTRVTAEMTNKDLQEFKVKAAEAMEDIHNDDKEGRKILWAKVNLVNDRVVTHDAVIPNIEKRLDGIDSKLDRILSEVRLR